MTEDQAMNDKELADRVVALGVGERRQATTDIHNIPIHGMYHYEIDGAKWPNDLMLEDELVRDWRVAGALMEKAIKDTGLSPSQWFCPHTNEKLFGVMFEDSHGRSLENAMNGSLPRAIIEACVEALSE
jgi:hypothetical protein